MCVCVGVGVGVSVCEQVFSRAVSAVGKVTTGIPERTLDYRRYPVLSHAPLSAILIVPINSTKTTLPTPQLEVKIALPAKKVQLFNFRIIREAGIPEREKELVLQAGRLLLTAVLLCKTLLLNL